MSFEEDLEKELERTKGRNALGCSIIIIIFIAVIGLLIFGPIFWFNYETNFAQRSIVTSDSPGNINTIEIFETGEALLKGPSSVRIKYGRDSKYFEVRNGGELLNSSNVSISWKNDYEAIVTLKGRHGEDEEVKINFE
ncbi:hypothetical protein [Virgibacillus kimchii]